MKGLQLPKGDKEVAAEIEFQRYFLYIGVYMLERWRIPGFSHLCDILEPITILFAIIRAMGDIREKSNSYLFDNAMSLRYFLWNIKIYF